MKSVRNCKIIVQVVWNLWETKIIMYTTCYEPWRGCVGKDPDAHGSGSEKGIYLRSRQKSNRGRSQNHGRSSRGEIQSQRVHKSYTKKVKAGKSEFNI